MNNYFDKFENLSESSNKNWVLSSFSEIVINKISLIEKNVNILKESLLPSETHTYISKEKSDLEFDRITNEIASIKNDIKTILKEQEKLYTSQVTLNFEITEQIDLLKKSNKRMEANIQLVFIVAFIINLAAMSGFVYYFFS